jgi:hypothetical protein
MKVFISHSHDEQLLAEAWKDLFGSLAPGIEVWYSSDRDPSGGVGTGRWREKIGQELERANVVLAIFTPESANRPWIFFECAFAMGLSEEKAVIPIIYYMLKDALPSPLQDQQTFQGDDRNGLMELSKRLIQMHAKKLVNEQFLALAVDAYLNQVGIHRQKRLEKGLFYGHFHTYETAKKLEGEWFAKWTKLQKDGKEIVFEVDTLKISTTECRIRIVGKGQKGALYPMEGIVSSKGHVALSYWSQEEITICGTVLLELIGGNRLMEGTWEGFTAKTLDDRLALIKGRVVIGRDKSKVEKYWDVKLVGIGGT